MSKATSPGYALDVGLLKILLGWLSLLPSWLWIVILFLLARTLWVMMDRRKKKALEADAALARKLGQQEAKVRRGVKVTMASPTPIQSNTLATPRTTPAAVTSDGKCGACPSKDELIKKQEEEIATLKAEKGELAKVNKKLNDKILELGQEPRFYLVIHNIQKPVNVKKLLRTAAAFGCHGVFVVGQKHFNLDPKGPDIPRSIHEFVSYEKQMQQQGNGNLDPKGLDIPQSIQEFMTNDQQQQQQDGMFLRRFEKWDDFVQYCRYKSYKSIDIIEVEIDEDAKSVDPVLGDVGSICYTDTVYVMGNEGQGLSLKQRDDCDGCVRIPLYGNETASLNVNAAASNFLQRVYQWKMEQE